MATNPKKDNRGGARPNSGPKSTAVSVAQLVEMRAAAHKKAEEEGKTLFQVCLDWIYDEDVRIERRQAAWKMYADKMLIQVSEGSAADQTVDGPAVYLPKQRPQLEIV